MTDRQIEENVLRELDADPQVRATHILVDVEEGIVTLSGCVDSEEQRSLAEQAARRVYGVHAVADELAIKRGWEGGISDTDLAREAVWAMEVHNMEVPANQIQMTVCEGWITLEGEVDWRYQKEAAEAAMGRLAGVRGVTNLIQVRPHLVTTEVRAPAGPPMRRRGWPCPGPAEEETEESWEIVKGNVSGWVQD